jgi:molybdate transport system substrate-binding protein
VRRPPRAVLGVAGLLVALLVVALVVRSCAGPEKTIEVYAASSLRHAFPEIAAEFEDEHDVAVDFTFESSGTLVGWLGERDRPDVLAVADGTSMFQANPVLTGEPLVFAQNRLVLVVPEGNPDDVTGIDDAALDEVATCHLNAPCGRLAQMTFEQAGVDVPRVEAANAAETLGRVVDGSADAGLVYATDARSAQDDVDLVELPNAGYRINFAAISLLDGAPDPEEGQEFVDFVVGEAGQEILAEHGFASAENPHLQPED